MTWAGQRGLEQEHQDNNGGRVSAKDRQAQSRVKLSSFACAVEAA